MSNIDLKTLRKIVSEELKSASGTKVVREQIDHSSMKDVVTLASKLLGAAEAFKDSATPSMINAVTPHLESILVVLEDMVSTPSSYVMKKKSEPRKVSLKPVKD